MTSHPIAYTIAIILIGCAISVFLETDLLRKLSTKPGATAFPAPVSPGEPALVRIYPTWKNYSYCSPSTRADPMNSYAQKQPIQNGFLFIKNEKSASSTCAAVHSRIAKQVGQRVLSDQFEATANESDTVKKPICENRGHSHLWSTRLQRRCKPHFKCLKGRHESTFVWSMIRDATKQKISLYYHFFVSMKHLNTTSDEHFKDFVNKTSTGEFYYSKLVHPRFNGTRMATDDEYVAQEANKTLHNLDFIGVVERIEESLAALGLLLQVPPSDLIYLEPSKLSGTYLPHVRGKSCYLLQKADLSDYMKEYFDSDEWKRKNRFNHALYKAANASLDATIESFGHDVFDKYLARYRADKELAARECKASSPCGPNGEYVGRGHRCLNGNMGCDDACLDRLFANATF